MVTENPHIEEDSVDVAPDHRATIAIHLVSGMCAGLVNVAVGLPMDTVKVKMQTFPQQNQGMLRCFANTVRSDGILRGLYAGAVPAIVANMGENAVLFVAYGQCQKIVASAFGLATVDEMGTLGKALSGSAAAVFSSLILCPTEHVKCQLQVRRELMKSQPTTAVIPGPVQLTKDIIRREGVKGLYRGLRPTWSRELPGYFFFFGGYETAKLLLSRRLAIEKDQMGLLPQLFCGSVAGVTFWTGIFPLDVIKSRIQVKGQSGTMFEVARSIAQEQGFRGFYKGLAPCILRAFPATASLLATYEYVNNFLSSCLLVPGK